MLDNNNLNELKKRVSECLDIALRCFYLDELTKEKIKKELLTDKLDYYVQLLEINSTLYVVRAMKAAIRTRLDDDQTYKVLEDKADDKTSKVDESIKKIDLEQEAGIYDKRGEIFNKWSEIIQNKANELHMDINSFLDRLIINGKEFYGENFTEDLLNEPDNDKGREAVLELIDEVVANGNFDLKKISETLSVSDDAKIHSDLANVVKKVAEQKAANIDLTSLDKKKKALLDTFSDVVLKKIFGNHFNKEMIKNIDYDKELDEGLEALVLDGEAKFGSNFVRDLLNRPNDEVREVLKGLVRYKSDLNPKTLSHDEEEILDDVEDDKSDELKTEDYQKYGDPELMDFDDIDEPKLDEDIDDSKNASADNFVPLVNKKGKRKEAPKGLINKFKEKWKNPKFKKKIIVGALVLAAGLVATAVVITQLLTTQTVDSQMMTSLSNAANGAINNMGLTGSEANSVANAIDYSSIGAGDTIYADAYSAVSDANALSANEWVGQTPIDVFDTVSGEYLNLSSEQLNDPELMQNLMSDGNHSLLVGRDGEASGFINNEGFQELVNHGRSR